MKKKKRQTIRGQKSMNTHKQTQKTGKNMNDIMSFSINWIVYELKTLFFLLKNCLQHIMYEFFFICCKLLANWLHSYFITTRKKNQNDKNVLSIVANPENHYSFVPGLVKFSIHSNWLWIQKKKKIFVWFFILTRMMKSVKLNQILS